MPYDFGWQIAQATKYPSVSEYSELFLSTNTVETLSRIGFSDEEFRKRDFLHGA